MIRTLVTALAATLFATLPPSAQTWTAGGNGLFFIGANWSGGSHPTNGTNAYFTHSGGRTVTMSNSVPGGYDNRSLNVRSTSSNTVLTLNLNQFNRGPAINGEDTGYYLTNHLGVGNGGRGELVLRDGTATAGYTLVGSGRYENGSATSSASIGGRLTVDTDATYRSAEVTLRVGCKLIAAIAAGVKGSDLLVSDIEQVRLLVVAGLHGPSVAGGMDEQPLRGGVVVRHSALVTKSLQGPCVRDPVVLKAEFGGKAERIAVGRVVGRFHPCSAVRKSGEFEELISRVERRLEDAIDELVLRFMRFAQDS